MGNHEMGGSIIELTTSALAGALLGSLYFGGLWFTVRHASQWHNPGLAVAVSLLLRLGMIAIGLYLVADGHWQRYAAAVPGLLAARQMWHRRIEPGRDKP